MSHYRANIERGDPAWAVTMNFGSTCTEQICTKAWVGEKVNVQTHIVTYMSPKITDMQGLGIENGGFCVGCPGGWGGCYLTQQTLPMCLTTAQLDPCCCISVFLMRHPHLSNVNLISEVTRWTFFLYNLLQNSCAGVKLKSTQWCCMRALVYIRWCRQ